MIERHIEAIKGYTVSATGFATWALTRADIDSWIGSLAGLGGLILVLLTIAEKLRKWAKSPRRACKEEEP